MSPQHAAVFSFELVPVLLHEGLDGGGGYLGKGGLVGTLVCTLGRLGDYLAHLRVVRILLRVPTT